MIIKNIIGLLLCAGLFFVGFLINGNLSLYFNLSGLLIVIGGTMAAAFLSFRWQQLAIASKVVASSYSHHQKTESEIIEILINLSVKSRMEGVLSLQEEENETSTLFYVAHWDVWLMVTGSTRFVKSSIPRCIFSACDGMILSAWYEA